MHLITRLWDAIVRLIRPDVDAIISAFVKAQSKLEKLIARELAALSAEAQAIADLERSRYDRNATVDRAYRVIHKLDQIVG